LVRNITNIGYIAFGYLHECQSFIVHAKRRRLLRHQTVKKVFEAYARIYVNAVTHVTSVNNILLNLVSK